MPRSSRFAQCSTIWPSSNRNQWGLRHREGPVRRREDRVQPTVLGVDGPGRDVAPVHGRVDRDHVADRQCLVDVVSQVGEPGPQPQRGRGEPRGSRDLRRRRLDRVLPIDGTRVVQGVEVGAVPFRDGVDAARRDGGGVGGHTAAGTGGCTASGRRAGRSRALRAGRLPLDDDRRGCRAGRGLAGEHLQGVRRQGDAGQGRLRRHGGGGRRAGARRTAPGGGGGSRRARRAAQNRDLRRGSGGPAGALGEGVHPDPGRQARRRLPHADLGEAAPGGPHRHDDAGPPPPRDRASARRHRARRGARCPVELPTRAHARAGRTTTTGSG
jgi:hypothetical protein